MKIVVKILVVVFFLLGTAQMYAQDKFHVHLDYNYLSGFYEKSDLWSIKSGLNGFDINITGMHDFNNRLSAGIGIGVEKLYDPAYTIFPVFVKISYSPIKSTEKPYVFTKLGYGIGTGTSNAGLLFNTGLGYKIKLRDHFGFNFMLGYHLQSIRYNMNFYSEEGAIDTKVKHNYRQSFSLGLGFIF